VAAPYGPDRRPTAADGPDRRPTAADGPDRRPTAAPTRRTVLTSSALAVLAAAGTAGCSPVLPWASPPQTAPDVGVLRDVIAAENEIIATYSAVLAAFPDLAPAVAPLRGQHQEHLAQLKGRLVVPPGARPSAAASASPAGRRGHPAARPPWASAAEAVAGLRAAERAEAATLVARLASVPPSLAQLFASIGASEAAHAAVLQAAVR
jgi:hypothetical protein